LISVVYVFATIRGELKIVNKTANMNAKRIEIKRLQQLTFRRYAAKVLSPFLFLLFFMFH